MIYNLNPSKHGINAVRVGFLGGTFDPPHNGHLMIAQKAIEELSLEEVNFAPARMPPHKPGEEITPIRHRVEMVRLAIRDNPRFVLSYIDVDREGPSYSVDSLRILRDAWHDSIEIYFLMGTDSLASILSWHNPEELIRMCKLAVFARPGFTANLDELATKLPEIRRQIVFINSAIMDISATEIQRRVHSGESIKELVPEPVEQYIRANKLYRL
jgi:nicotinate-nucleotide adenylyltransferase